MTLVYVMHPNMEQSTRCKEVLEHIKKQQNVTIRYVQETFKFTEQSVKEEQEAMLKADQIVFLYPVYWWALPGHAKMFVDKVFLPTFAYVYGVPHHAKLHNKKFRAIMTTGGPSKFYQDTSILTTNMKQIYGEYMGMQVQEPFIYFSDQTTEDLKQLKLE
uniref:NADPH oxidoreductase n=1 Tax=Trepomonas sp. PC1 TaxID=1076344 RepID=A0A146KDC7_9EUKA|eukprot:JAP93496.1 NADPH oxidoreductase [Trepomonas sp. PC1]